ncbi:hypothetical protein [uncultured Shewanella sp.]|uniref:hypothetical protein n=1 Tax=uncultured Shewanella sp. TaxID=173975 RepID=UPI0026281F36|nr:hypothetical protein [uncultured Shewanella sp.]
MPNISATNIHSPAQSESFFKLADVSNDRVIINHGEPEIASKFRTRSGSVIADKIVSALGSHGQSEDRYQIQNGAAHSMFARFVRADFPEIGDAATQQLNGKQISGHRLTPSDILFVKTNLVGLQKDPQQAREMQALFVKIGEDPRFIAMLEGQASALALSADDSALTMADSGGAYVADKALSAGGAASSVLPIIKTGVQMGGMVSHGNKQGQLQSVANALKHHQVDNKLGSYIASNLAADHEYTAEKLAIKATASTVLTGLGKAHAIDLAIDPLLNGVGSAVHDMTADVIIDKGIELGADEMVDEGIDQPLDFIDRRRSDIVSLPRIEVVTDSGYHYFDMNDRRNLDILLTYLGAGENTTLTDPNIAETFSGLKEGEQARLALKTQLGSHPCEHIVKGERTEADNIMLNKMGNNRSLSSFLADIRSGRLEDNQDYFNASEQERTEYKALRNASLDQGRPDNMPSPLRLVMLAEGLL